MNFIQHINDSIEYANSGVTKLNSKAINMEGMSSIKVRNFLNKLVSYPDVSYLEIGVWKGSTFYSALYGNKPKCALAIDNFSQFDGSELAFNENMSDINTEFSFINASSFENKVESEQKFNVYFYDGNHSFDGQKKALTYYHDILTDEYIYICDDWGWEEVRGGTMAGVKEKQLEILQEWRLTANDGWWNGLWVAVLRKTI